MHFQNLNKGNLLIAEPSLMGDSSFSKSVVLLADLNENGSVGFILNKPLKLFLNDLVEEIEIPLPIYKGGPVEQDSLYFIHKVPELIRNSIQIDEDLYWGGDYNDLVKGINTQTIKVKDIRFFLGYSGWTKDQLYNEIDEKSWIVSLNEHSDRIIHPEINQLWKKKMIQLGGNYAIWSNAPEDPHLN